MKKVILVVLVAVFVSACGATHHTTAAEKQQGNAAIAAFDRAALKCLPTKDGAPDVFVLKSHAGRHKFGECAVPTNERVQVDRCGTRVLLGGLPTANRIKTGIGGCLLKAGL